MEEGKLINRIERNPEIMFGKPVIRVFYTIRE